MKQFAKDAEGRKKKVLKRRHEEATHKGRIKSRNVQLEEDFFH